MQKHRIDLGYSLGVLAAALGLMVLWPGLLQNLLVKNGFMPHGHCYLWKPSLVWLHLTSDTLIGLAYVVISSTLAYLVYKSRQDIPFHWMFLYFGTFIVACGATHFMAVWTLWTPMYWLSGEVKLITAVASVTTAMLLPPLVPQALSLIQTAKMSEQRKSQLEEANRELETLYEKLKEVDKLKTQFFANLSHELRTPLALILGPTEKLLKSSTLSDEQHHDLATIDRNARTLLKHVNDLLDVSKLEAGKMSIHYAEVNLASLLRLSAAHFESLAAERQINFLVESPESVPAQVDPDKIQRICLNLISNAFKFTPLGGRISCRLDIFENASTTEDSSPMSYAAIRVADSGLGIPENLREVIFEPFHQAEESSTRQFGGTGLGLAIVKDFVELHGGTVTVSDAPEGGALFTVTLPLVAIEQFPVQSIAQYKELKDISRQIVSELRSQINDLPPVEVMSPISKSVEVFTPINAPLVLVVEDNPEMNQFITETLASEYRTESALNGKEGLEKAIALHPDLILSDIMMPKFSGDRLVQEIRKHPELDATPIILLSAKTDETLRVNLLRSGAQDYLTKPFSAEELRSRIGNLVAMKQTRDILQQELESKNQDVATLANNLASRKRELELLASELEVRVEKRTIELQTTNQLLQVEIIERQRVELELQKEEEFLKAVLDNVKAGIVACDERGILTLFNPTAREFHGLPEQPLLAEEWAQHYDLYLPDGETVMKREDIPLWQALQGERVDNVEMKVVPKQGVTRTLLASGQGIFNPQREKLGAVVVMHDISDRKRVEEERAQLLREQIARVEAEVAKWRFAFLAEARMELSSSLDYKTTVSRVARLAVPTLADYCIIDLVDRDGSIQQVEVAHLDPAKEELMREVQHRYPPDLKLTTGVAQVLRTGKSEIVQNITDGQLETNAEDAEHLKFLQQLAPKSAMLVPLNTRGNQVGVISLISAESEREYNSMDLTLAEDLAHSIALAIDNSRLYSEAQEANRMKDEFLATLSHELRTPLNSMLGWVQLLRTRKFDEGKIARALETIERNARSQSQMIEELLDVSRMMRGKIELNTRQVDLVPAIEAALESFRPMAQAKEIDLRFSVLPDTEGQTPKLSIFGDFDRLQQIVGNLVTNAIKFTSFRGVVKVELSRTNDFAQIQVIDNGCGISPDFLPYVFERFRQQDSTTTRSQGGLGLGLAIVRYLVELQSGKVTAESLGDGLGSTFTVRFPLLEVSRNTEKGNNCISPAQSSTPLQGLRILLVDDEADSLEVISTILDQYGAEVTAVNSANKALFTLNQKALDLLVSDIGMPKKDGYALIRQVRQQEEKTGKHLRAIALTAYAGEEDRDKVVAAGFEMHVAKPVEPERLVQAIVTLVSS